MEVENNTKASTPQRLKYDAEVSVIISKIGDIEEVRSSLGLSQRKISQLLMVDPSAWTRWAHGKTKTPAHIYRALQWYLALIEKNGEWHPQNSFMKAFQNTNATSLKQTLEGYKMNMDEQLKALEHKTEIMSLQNQTSKWLLKGLILFCLTQASLIAFLLFKFI